LALAKYLLPRGKKRTLYVRLAVPEALQPIIGRTENIRSTRTSDPDLAARKAMSLLAEWFAEFDRAAGQSTPAYDAPADLSAFAVGRAFAPTLEQLENSRRNVPDDDALYDKHLEQRQSELRRLTRWRQDGMHAAWEATADRIIENHKLPIAKGTPEYTSFVESIADSTIDAYSVHTRRNAGEVDAEPQSKVVRRALELESNKAASGETLLELFEQWSEEALAKHKADPTKGKRPDTINQDRKAIKQFAEFVGPKRDVRSITAVEVAEYRDTMRKLPPKWMNNKHLRGLGMREAAAKARLLGLPQMTFTNVNKHLSTISPLYKWLLRHPAWAGMKNPVDNLFYPDVKGSNPRPPFTTAQLNEILSSPLFTGFQADGKEHLKGNCRADDYRYWIPLICLFTGARLGEIAQLRVDDVRKERGVWFMHIVHDESTGQTTKSGFSRAAPIHSKLIELGFLKFHARQVARASVDGNAGMFPELEPNNRGQISGKVSRWWRDYLKGIEVKAKKGGDGFGTHSFRHTMADLLRVEAELLDDQIEVALGHNQKTTTGGYGRLKQGTVTMLQGYFEAVRFDGVDFSVLA
jgi:integrase